MNASSWKVAAVYGPWPAPALEQLQQTELLFAYLFDSPEAQSSYVVALAEL